ncbi:MAG: hypothetical protein AAF668_14660 [Pseudomonadota bacterium]
MTIIREKTILDTTPDRLFEEVSKSAALLHVSKGMMSFTPIDPPHFPELWEERKYLVSMKFAGALPIGTQIIGIEIPPPSDGRYFVRDNGYSDTIKKWDHMITIEPTGDGRSAYEDRLDIDAGWRTPFVAAFAKAFYAHRQRNWKKLVDSGFVY